MSRAACKEEACAYALESKVNTIRALLDMGALTENNLFTAATVYERAAEYLDDIISEALARDASQ